MSLHIREKQGSRVERVVDVAGTVRAGLSADFARPPKAKPKSWASCTAADDTFTVEVISGRSAGGGSAVNTFCSFPPSVLLLLLLS